MTQIKRLYASSGPEVIIETLQITIGSDVHYLCRATRVLRQRRRTAIP